MQTCIDDVKSWMTANKLKLNDDKTEVMLVSSSLMAKTLSVPDSMTVGNASVLFSETVRNLGFTIDNQAAADTLTRGIYISGAEPAITNTIIQDNSVTDNGAGIYIDGAASGAIITDSVIGGTSLANGNVSSTNGGGVYISGGSPTPTAAAARPRYRAIVLSPPEDEPSPPGVWTLWVASKTTG